MTPPKKAAKKTAQTIAGDHRDKNHQTKDLRRAYEHMGRLDILRKALKASAAEAVGALAKLAQKEIEGRHNKSAADLLRASEHLSFAALAGDHLTGGHISAELEHSITEHFDELLRRADERWEDNEQHSSTLTALYQSSRKNAVKAFKDGAYHQALEFARAAEALAHVKLDGPHKLERGDRSLRLKGA